MALGATRANVLGLILRDGMRLTGFGVAIGLILASLSTRLLVGLLFTVSPLDAVAFAGMSMVFVAVALLACYLPARRAAVADPIAVLRAD